MAEKTEERKAEHIKICLNERAQARKRTAGFEDVNLIHRALPEINKAKIDLSAEFLNHRFSAPLIVGAMTGGTSKATKINAVIAETVEDLHLGMGVGSQRAAIEKPKLEKTFSIVRKKAPTAFIIANIGGVQLVHGYGLKEIRKAIEMIDADALAIHLNALQEAVQPEGQTNFEAIIPKIAEIAEEIDKPIIVKETGCGIAAEEAKKLVSAGIKAIDIAGTGGTSFAAVEYYRAKEEDNPIQHFLGNVFWDWGIPTVVSLVEIAQTVKIPVIAAGGVRSGSDIAKALALNACLASISQPVLEAASKNAKETERVLSFLIEELKNIMFLVGAERIGDMSKTPIVITGKTGEWLRTRGFEVENYARRGAK